MTDARQAAISAERLYEVVIDDRLRVIGIERRDGIWIVRVDGRPRVVELAEIDRDTFSLRFPEERGRIVEIGVVQAERTSELALHVDGKTIRVRAESAGTRRQIRPGTHGTSGPGPVTAPMPGKVVRILVAPGDVVVARQAVAVVEAMKMENELRALKAGVVKEILVREGTLVDAGAALVLIE